MNPRHTNTKKTKLGIPQTVEKNNKKILKAIKDKQNHYT
jgi:hypothetical protein